MDKLSNVDPEKAEQARKALDAHMAAMKQERDNAAIASAVADAQARGADLDAIVGAIARTGDLAEWLARPLDFGALGNLLDG